MSGCHILWSSHFWSFWQGSFLFRQEMMISISKCCESLVTMIGKTDIFQSMLTLVPALCAQIGMLFNGNQQWNELNKACESKRSRSNYIVSCNVMDDRWYANVLFIINFHVLWNAFLILFKITVLSTWSNIFMHPLHLIL